MFLVSSLISAAGRFPPGLLPIVPDLNSQVVLDFRSSTASSTYCEGEGSCWRTLLVGVRVPSFITVARLSAEVVSWATSVMLSWEMVV